MGHSGLRIALLDTSDSPFTERNFRRELDADLVEYDVAGGELPAHHDFDAAVVTGSEASVYGDEPWIDGLLSWLETAHERSMPLLGVCFGHQAVAAALGGEVADMGADTFELGYREVAHDGGVLFEGIDERFTVFVTHGDEVVTLPPGAEPLAENDRSLHAFRKDEAWGMQFHPEYDLETAREVASGKDDELPADEFEAALDTITAEGFDAACEAKQLFENFTDFVAARRPVETADGTGAAGD
ncbi:MAG: type 1 glutamine amidotransferase [Halobacteriaceae archaeon]